MLTQPVMPRAMQTWSVPRPSAMTRAMRSSRVGIEEIVLMTKNTASSTRRPK